MAPTDPFFMLGGGVLAIADQEIGFSGKFVQRTRRRGGRLIIRCKNQRALLGRVFDPIGEATTGMGDSGCVDEKGVGSGGELDGMVGNYFVKSNLGLKKRKSRRKEGFALLGVERSLDEVAGVSSRKTGRVDGDVDIGQEAGSKKGEALDVIPVGVGKEKGEGAAALGRPIETCLAKT